MCERCEKLEYALREIVDWADKLEYALREIVDWADAYPVSDFREPTEQQLNLAHTLLKAHGMTLDAFSASMARHCLQGVGDIAREALG